MIDVIVFTVLALLVVFSFLNAFTDVLLPKKTKRRR